MATEVTLSAAARTSLLSLAATERLINRTNDRLSSGLRVASPVDDARVFFEAKTLSDRSSSLNERRDGIDQAISSVSAALEAIESIDSLVRQAKGLAIAAKSATGTEFQDLKTEYDSLRTQINNLAGDATYQGLNLVNDSTASLLVSFSDLTTSSLTISGVDVRASALGIEVFSAAIGGSTETVAGITIDSALADLDAAVSTLRGNASTIGSNVSLLQTRLDFTEKYTNVLDEGSGKLTLASITEEGANLVALQTRQQLGISSLAFAGQSEQSVLALFR